MTKLYCLQRDFICENEFSFYELESTDFEKAVEEVEETISNTNTQEWIITEEERQTILNLLKDDVVQTPKMDLNEEMIKYEGIKNE
jgi:hypothetical protein